LAPWHLQNNAGEQALEHARVRLAESGFDVQANQLSGEPESVIADMVRNERIHLLVMGACGHSRIRQFIVGSTTTMVRTCAVPVLMFR
jgi:nucleotide-binding universal stress UspA family protein